MPSHNQWTNDVHSLQSTYGMFTSNLVMQHTTDAPLSPSAFNFFFVLLSDLLAMSSSSSQSPDNTVFEQSIKFSKSMKTLPVHTSYLICSRAWSLRIQLVFFQVCDGLIWFPKVDSCKTLLRDCFRGKLGGDQ